ncbi:hypothetical protein SAV31267_010280 [Streptomyces avermitilis]|nr:hypothetical protein SAV31267_010280 [Streptomyces avermitilis]
MAAAAAAFPVWRDSTPSTRQRLLLKIADAVEARADELVEAECRDTGKPRAVTRTEEIVPMVDQLRFFAGAARLLEGKAAGEYMEGLTSIIRREPIGVCAQVAPWNYPMMTAVWKFAPAIAAGNTVVLKPSDTTPASTVLLAGIVGDVLKEMDLPAGVLNVVCGDRNTGQLMVEHPVPAMAAITGSVRAGIQVAESAAKDVKRVHLELGGKAPVVVFGDADIAQAVEGVTTAGFFNAGQDCTAATRVLVHESVHDEFVAALAEAAAGVRTGGIDEEGVLFGPLNNVHQLAQVSGFVDRLPRTPRSRQAVTASVNRATSTLPPSSPAWSRRTRSSRTRSSVRSSPSSPSRTRTRPWSGPTASTTLSPPRSGRRTTPARCACRSASTSAAYGSTPT